MKKLIATVLATLLTGAAGATTKGIETDVNERTEMKERIREVAEQHWEEENERHNWSVDSYRAFDQEINGQRITYFVQFGEGSEVFDIAYELYDEDTFHFAEFGYWTGSKKFEKEVEQIKTDYNKSIE